MWTICWVEADENQELDRWILVKTKAEVKRILTDMKKAYGDITEVKVFPPKCNLDPNKLLLEE